MKQEQDQDRSEPASPFKLAEAKKKGQVAKSLDVNSWFAVGALIGALLLWGTTAWGRLVADSRLLLQAAGPESAAPLALLGQAANDFVWVVLPFAGVAVLLAIGANLAQTGPVFSFEPLKPQFERLNPAAGFKRVFNKRMLFEALKSILKLTFFGAVAYLTLAGFWPELPSLYTADTHAQSAWLADHGIGLLVRLALALLVVALIDLAFVRWQYGKQMRMSRREMREEVKRREGDPLTRAKLRQLQRELRQQGGSLARVAEADVLITNPEHVAVALAYDRSRMSAPHIVAKGQERWAAELRRAARRHGVPVHEQRALARTLFRHGHLDRPIPADAYVGVALVYGEIVIPRQRAARVEVRT